MCADRSLCPTCQICLANHQRPNQSLKSDLAYFEYFESFWHCILWQSDRRRWAKAVLAVFGDGQDPACSSGIQPRPGPYQKESLEVVEPHPEPEEFGCLAKAIDHRLLISSPHSSLYLLAPLLTTRCSSLFNVTSNEVVWCGAWVNHPFEPWRRFNPVHPIFSRGSWHVCKSSLFHERLLVEQTRL